MVGVWCRLVTVVDGGERFFGGCVQVPVLLEDRFESHRFDRVGGERLCGMLNARGVEVWRVDEEGV